VFKRLRDGLLGRADPSAPDEQQITPATDAPETADTADIADASQIDDAADVADPADAEVEDAAPVETPPAERAAPLGDQPGPLGADADTVDADDEGDIVDAADEGGASRRGFFRNPFKFSLGRTRQLFGQMNAAFEEADEITEDLWDELEETLISSDVGVKTTEQLMATLRQQVQAEDLKRGSELRDALKEELELLLGDPEPLVFSDTSPISVYLVVGVNGVGKTTSIAKLANQLKRQKHRVLMAAGDTFRAAATEQLRTWGERIGVQVVAHQHGADPAAVVYDAMQAAQARGTDVLIVDTAGRLHTKYNLMEELKKIVRVLQKYDPESPHEVLLVIDATTGQNGFLQAKQFVQDAGVSGVILTKLDGTARGGIAFAIAAELGLPIKYVGTGERINDIAPFDAQEFVDALFDEP
jgi:fused signal recognition particle receptor